MHGFTQTLQFAQGIGVDVLNFYGDQVLVQTECQHLIVILKIAEGKSGTDGACWCLRGWIEAEDLEIPVGRGECEHFAQLAAAKDADFLCGGKHDAKVRPEMVESENRRILLVLQI